MRLFTLILLAFFASFASFGGQKFVFSELLFLLSGIIGGRYIKGLEPGTYRFFELFLIGFFGTIYGLSLDFSMVFKTAKKSLKLALLDALIGVVYLLLISIAFHQHHIALKEKLAILSFIIVGASPYFVKTLQREEIVASFFLPALIAISIGIVGFTYKSSFLLVVTVLITGIILKFTEEHAKDTTTALSIILGGAILIPYIAINYGQSPFFYSFLLGVFLTNILRSKRLMDLLLVLKEDERLLFLVFLFMIGLFTRIDRNTMKIAALIFALRVIYKFMVARAIYSTGNALHFISQGALSLIIAIDIIGHGEIIRGWGASIVMAYMMSQMFTGFLTLRAKE